MINCSERQSVRGGHSTDQFCWCTWLNGCPNGVFATFRLLLCSTSCGRSEDFNRLSEPFCFEGDRNRMNIYLGGILWVGVAAVVAAAAAYLMRRFGEDGGREENNAAAGGV